MKIKLQQQSTRICIYAACSTHRRTHVFVWIACSTHRRSNERYRSFTFHSGADGGSTFGAKLCRKVEKRKKTIDDK